MSQISQWIHQAFNKVFKNQETRAVENAVEPPAGFHNPSQDDMIKYLSGFQSVIDSDVYDETIKVINTCQTTEELVDSMYANSTIFGYMDKNPQYVDILRFMTLEQTKMANLGSLQLCKFIKSSDKIAQASQEKWTSIQPEIGKIYQSSGRPLCWTDTEHALTFLQYGDKVIYGDTSPATLEKDGLQNEPVLRGGTDVYTEYLIQKIPVGQIRDLRDIENVKYLLLHAKDTDLVKLFANPQTLNGVIVRWKMYGGFKDSIAMLEHIQQATITTDANELREAIASYDKQPAMYIEAPIEPEL